jgi:hypothetical protein
LEGVTGPLLETAMSTTAPPDPPDFFTVEEAARVLRIGRTAAYALSRRWRDTEGREGLPVVPVGRLLRVPRSALEEMTGGRITTSPTTPNEPASSRVSEGRGVDRSRVQLPHTPSQQRRRARSSSSDQPTLPLT